MDSDQAYVIDGSISSPLLLDDSLKLSKGTPHFESHRQKDPCVMVAASLLLSVTGYYIILRSLDLF